MATQVKESVSVFCRFGIHFRYLPKFARMIYACRGCQGNWVRDGWWSGNAWRKVR